MDFLQYPFIIATIIQLLFWVIIFSRFALQKKKKPIILDEVPVSIVICAMNEETNLKKNLDRILNQSYRSFEVIVVNDCSTDRTTKVLLEYQKKYPYLRIVNNHNKTVGKKYALSLGIKFTKNNVLLLTDADCLPTGPNWLKGMQNELNQSAEIVLGYGPYKKLEGFLNRFIQFETHFTALQYFSFALSGMPYMGVGRNMMYRKTLFTKSDGFDSHKNYTSGDDDLFVNEVIRRDNFSLNLNYETFMYSEPVKSWKSYFLQKDRHMSTGTAYKPIHQLMLGLLSTSHFIHIIGALLLCSFTELYSVVLIYYLARLSIVWLIWFFVLKKLNDIKLWWWIPILDFLFAFYYLTFTPSLFKSNFSRWT